MQFQMDTAFTLADFFALHSLGLGMAVGMAVFGAIAFATLTSRYL